MKTFTNADIIDYYHHTEVHYRRFWQLDQAMGLHYGLWDTGVKDLAGAIRRVNERLAQLGSIPSGAAVLDAGCGIGGSSFFLAQRYGCQTIGITLSDRQVARAKDLAARKHLTASCRFMAMDYTDTSFPDASFDVVWAIESLGSAQEKALFFREAHRVLKPGGSILIADTFKPIPYPIGHEPVMQTMLNGWAISDILAIPELRSMGHEQGFATRDIVNVSAGIQPSVDRIYRAAQLGSVGTWAYNLYRRATPFSRIHYLTGLAQKIAFEAGKWGYYLVHLTKLED